MMKFSQSTGGFYEDGISIDIPSDAVDVDQRTYAGLLEAQSKGASIVPSESGDPQAIAGDGTIVDLAIVAQATTYVLVPPLTLAQQATTAFSSASDRMWDEYGVVGDAVPAVWSAYMKAVRAIANGTDKVSIALPSEPAE